MGMFLSNRMRKPLALDRLFYAGYKAEINLVSNRDVFRWHAIFEIIQHRLERYAWLIPENRRAMKIARIGHSKIDFDQSI
jgi:hypothetical protein